MFSKTMMASSTTIPMARERANRVKVFIVKPIMCRTEKVPMMAVGMAKMTLMVMPNWPKNNQQTKDVKMAAKIRVKSIS